MMSVPYLRRLRVTALLSFAIASVLGGCDDEPSTGMDATSADMTTAPDVAVDATSAPDVFEADTADDAASADQAIDQVEDMAEVRCTADSDCTMTGYCNLGTGMCDAPTCMDGVMNQDESDTDCGGACGATCGDTDLCNGDADCVSEFCHPTVGSCATPSCLDGLQNQDETGADCGGATCMARCGLSEGCLADDDCQSLYCDATTSMCSVATCVDNIQNQGETDEDCGGPNCAACTAGQNCMMVSDCEFGLFCDGATSMCAAPAETCSDMIQNQDESDTDCGGVCGAICIIGESCGDNADCVSDYCDPSVGDTCQMTPGGCMDMVQNQDETDTDCGGVCGASCVLGEGCADDGDCVSGYCGPMLSTCQTPPPPATCWDILQADPTAQSGPYIIDPAANGTGFLVYCEMEAAGGGWTLCGKFDRDFAGGDSMVATGWARSAMHEADMVDTTTFTGGQEASVDCRDLITSGSRYILNVGDDDGAVDMAGDFGLESIVPIPESIISDPSNLWDTALDDQNCAMTDSGIATLDGDFVPDPEVQFGCNIATRSRAQISDGSFFSQCGRNDGAVFSNAADGDNYTGNDTVFWCWPDGDTGNGCTYGTCGTRIGSGSGGGNTASRRYNLMFMGRGPVPITGGLTSGNAGIWSDGSMAATCADYADPPAGYAFAGSTGSGTYMIDPDGDGTGFEVYCDMRTDTGGWTLCGKFDRDFTGGDTMVVDGWARSVVNGADMVDVTTFTAQESSIDCRELVTAGNDWILNVGDSDGVSNGDWEQRVLIPIPSDVVADPSDLWNTSLDDVACACTPDRVRSFDDRFVDLEGLTTHSTGTCSLGTGHGQSADSSFWTICGRDDGAVFSNGAAGCDFTDDDTVFWCWPDGDTGSGCNAGTCGTVRIGTGSGATAAATQRYNMMFMGRMTARVSLSGSFTAGDPSRYSDGYAAATCWEYRHPPAGYEAATQSGAYRLGNYGGAAVYCDMETHGGGWTLVGKFDRDFAGGDRMVPDGFARADINQDDIVDISTFSVGQEASRDVRGLITGGAQRLMTVGDDDGAQDMSGAWDFVAITDIPMAIRDAPNDIFNVGLDDQACACTAAQIVTRDASGTDQGATHSGCGLGNRTSAASTMFSQCGSDDGAVFSNGGESSCTTTASDTVFWCFPDDASGTDCSAYGCCGTNAGTGCGTNAATHRYNLLFAR